MQISDRKSGASRANGAKSRGPTSPEGKAVSSRNAERHVVAARAATLQGESDPRIQAVLADYTARFLPADCVERDIVTSIVINRWRAQRVIEIEAALVETECTDLRAELKTRYDCVTDGIRVAAAYKSLADRSRSLSHFSRHENRLNSAYLALIRTLERLQSLREKKQNEPTSPVVSTKQAKNEPETNPPGPIQAQND